MSDLYQRYQQFAAEHPNTHHRDAAAALGVSEGALLAALPETRYLGGNVAEFLAELPTLDTVINLVRNDLAVHEKKGEYKNLQLSPFMGMVANQDGLDLRLFLKHWKHIFQTETKGLRSFQFFDAHGNAIQKVYLSYPVSEQQPSAAQIAAWEALGERYAVAEAPVFEPQPPAEPYRPRTFTAAELADYRARWQQLEDVHRFRELLAEFGIDRLHGLELAAEGDAVKLKPEAAEWIYRRAGSLKLPVLSFVGNNGIVQIQTGAVHNIVRARGYLNILDDQEEGFSLHLKDDGIAGFWFVRRAGVHSFEAYDSRRQLVLQIFGRPAKTPDEPQAWRDLVAEAAATFAEQA